ncbi:MAG: diguanylate cyclase [Candidatus Omnitrophica bacterium]|nr:diguanylate cyclase [Candidatus Omnitrophota bacterium]
MKNGKNGSERVLLISANNSQRCALTLLLEENGLIVQSAADVVDADFVLEWQHIVVVLIDLDMDTAAAAALLHHVRHQTAGKVKLVVLLPPQAQAALTGVAEASADEYLFMPAHLPMISQAVKRNIKMYRLEKEREQYARLAIHDDLTKLYNRRFLALALKKEFARSVRSGQPLSLCLVDIDAFKQFNDTYGHKIGDLVLQSVAQSLKMELRQIDIVCRYGGEEFVLVLPETVKKAAVVAAERLRRIVERTLIPVNAFKEVPVTVSIGVANFPADCRDEETLLHYADLALYAVKQAGKNMIFPWDPSRCPVPNQDAESV